MNKGKTVYAKPEGKKKSVWIALLLMLVAMFLFDLAFQRTPEGETKNTMLNSQDLVNRHLQYTNRRMLLSEERALIENRFLAPEIGQKIQASRGSRRLKGIPMHSDQNEDRLADDLKGPSQELLFKTPNAQILGEIRDEDDQDRYEHAYQNEYIRQFIENARKNGYEVDVNADMIVTRVRRVPSSTTGVRPGRPNGSK